MAQGSINVNVGGIQYEEPSATYKRVVLKSNLSFKSQVEGSSNANSLFIIKWDFDLGGQTVNIPSNCILQFEGGVLRNGTVNLNNTRIWPCYDALTIGDVTITGTPLGGDGELFFKEYPLMHYDGDFVYNEEVIASDFDYYILPFGDIRSAANAYDHVKLGYGFTSCKVFIGNTNNIEDSYPNNKITLTNNTMYLPFEFTLQDLVSIRSMFGYFFLINKGTKIPRNLRIVY